MFPRIHLALDNCFASKRWTEPGEWMEIARAAGIFCMEASADNENDPLYSTPEVLRDWIEQVGRASARTGVRVVNLYSGHGTYATLGLAHPDQRIRDHIQHDWLEPMIGHAAGLGAGLGFFCHAFSQAVLNDPDAYARAKADLYRRLAELADYAAKAGVSSLSLEQMYSPHQIPWTLNGTAELLAVVYRLKGTPLYVTLDTGHQIGQRHYLWPNGAQIEQAILTGNEAQVWLSSAELSTVESVEAYIQKRPYLFAHPVDGDLYAWLRAFGCYSPIIHLQQTDGTVSAHRPFTAKYNREGIVSPQAVLAALYDSYCLPDPILPPCQDIYLTLELFSGTAERPANILANIHDSAAYWRQAVPEDGLTLDQLVEINEK
jgi:D-erythrulose 1-phosphate 3-epimerase